MGKEYPQMKREYQHIVISKLKVICQKLLIGRKHGHGRWFVSTSNDVMFEVVLYCCTNCQ